MLKKICSILFSRKGIHPIGNLIQKLPKNADEQQLPFYYPIELEQQFTNFVKAGDFENSKRIMEDIINRNISGGVLLVPFARGILFNFASVFFRVINDIGDIRESLFLNNPRRIEQITTTNTIKEVKDQLTELLREVCDYTFIKRQKNMNQARQQTLNELVEQIKVFIKEHYVDFNLNISMIGDHFDMNSAYLSRLFKEHTGEGMLDYINKLRIGYAKQMIVGQKSNIAEIAKRTGFNDVNVFIRTFKKYEGITPGKYI